MAAEISGILRAILLVSRVRVSVPAGNTLDAWGTSKTSSNVRASSILGGAMTPPVTAVALARHNTHAETFNKRATQRFLEALKIVG